MDDIIQKAIAEPEYLTAAEAELAIPFFQNRLRFLQARTVGLPKPAPAVDLVAPKNPAPFLRTVVWPKPFGPVEEPGPELEF